ncbi:MAG: hypothetical protein MUF13_13815 [Akkermansiaceae bacterium]|jgi:hypothetical protein|nr:hypothetical protein [Akkermansiaceae bacterium]
MIASRHVPLRKVMIPWVITLVALFGWNALSPEHVRARKGDAMEGVGLSQIADDPELPGRLASPQVFAASCPGSLEINASPMWSLVLVSNCSPSLPACSVAGAVRGRAPPVGGAWLMA